MVLKIFIFLTYDTIDIHTGLGERLNVSVGENFYVRMRSIKYNKHWVTKKFSSFSVQLALDGN